VSEATAAAIHGSTALFTDKYELTMLEASLADGSGDRPCVFEVFARRLPNGRRYGVVAGTGRLLDALATFSFGDDELASVRPTPSSGCAISASPATSTDTAKAISTSPAPRSCR